MNNRPIALVGVPYDEHSSFLKGAAEAPPLIREAFHTDAANYWSERLIDTSAEGILDDRGDLDLSASNRPIDEIEAQIDRIVSERSRIIILGGDHTVTIPVVRAVSRHVEDLNILHIDAHPDLYDELDGDRYSHACPFSRLMEEDRIRRLVQVGIRTMNGHQREQAERFGVEVHQMKDWADGTQIAFDGPLYISFDLDGLDPAFAPGVSHFEPGGLSTRQALDIIQNVRTPEIVGADIVEYNPGRDLSGVTAAVCAKLLKEIVSKMLEATDFGTKRF